MKRLGIALFLLGLAPAPWRAAGAEFYRWVDRNGVVHFTDNLHSIPKSQREGAARIPVRESPRAAEPEKPASPDKASIPFEKRGEVVIVEATLNRKTAARFVVDTGASYTFISAATAKALDLQVDPDARTVPFQTANGVIQAPLARLDSISVGGMEVENLTAAVHDALPGSTAAGLLGLNFLSRFRLDIDTEKGLLHLEKK
ncbi:MAG TPA: TIGR02281 family clan AA aspartic protease [candidate division Zixibacteria bacterium]|nr:TIGR02281 family clan AA aspartic protease [candidate division Zixibacteria bacterium]